MKKKLYLKHKLNNNKLKKTNYNNNIVIKNIFCNYKYELDIYNYKKNYVFYNYNLKHLNFVNKKI